MLLRELIRLSTQNRTLYCYSILSLWIFLLIAGMYKYIGTSPNSTFSSNKQYQVFVDQQNHEEKNEPEIMTKSKIYHQDCNPVETIIRKDDGGYLDGWTLQGVLLLTRHGDRGPMAHVRGINNVNCGYENSPLLNKYKTFLTNTSVTSTGNINNSGGGGGLSGGIAGGGSSASVPSSTGHAMWMKTGPFHGSPLLPSFAKSCMLGQLTYKGVSQLLQIGDILRQVYAHPLGLHVKSPLNLPPLPNGSQQTKSSTTNINNTTAQRTFPTDEIIIYSTRYRRTFQSAMALMFAFVPTERWQSLIIQESHSLAFCFTDCACPQAIWLKNELNKEAITLLSQHPAISSIVQWVGTTLLQNPSSQMQPMEVRDAVLSILCHNAPLPCSKRSISNDYRNGIGTSRVTHAELTTNDPNDFINIDQDDGAGGNNVHLGIFDNNKIIDIPGGGNIIVDTQSDPSDTEQIDGCLEQSHVTAIMSFTNWQGKMEARHKYTKQQGILRAYGFLRNIVNFILKIISGDKTKFVLYSGHDKTMQFLMAALGIPTDGRRDHKYFIPYAARMSFEIYKSDKNMEFYFRLVYNGKDITRDIDICEGGKSLRVNRDSRGNKADLCPVENIIRFIHDDYFGSVNATNYKDACVNNVILKQQDIF